jgi:uncharacterized phage protein (TIGR02216 family)
MAAPSGSFTAENDFPYVFPWNEVMAFGLGSLKLAPRDFWSMTPLELTAAASYGQKPYINAPQRHEFQTLINAFPD